MRDPAVVFQRDVSKEEEEFRVKEAFDVPRARSGAQPVPLRGLQEVQVCAAAGSMKYDKVRQDARRNDIVRPVGFKECDAEGLNESDESVSDSKNATL